MKRILLVLFPLYALVTGGEPLTSPALSAAAASPTATLWVFTVGVSQYRNNALSLQYADYDAESLATALQAQSGKVFRQVKTKVLVNQQTSRQGIVDEMRAFFAQAGADDVALVALMGHGVIEQEAFYFLPYPADLTNLSTEALPMTDFEDAVREVGKRVGRIILAVDTCHAGALRIRVRGISRQGTGTGRSRGVSLVEALPAAASDTYILSSSTAAEESLEDINYRLPGEEKGHGAFTYALLRGLRGEADYDQDQVVNVLDLFTYASKQVPKITGGRQTPSFRGEGTNFALAETPRTAKPEAVKEATVLVQKGREHQRKRELKEAQADFAQAQVLNPRDEVPELLRAQAKEELAYLGDPHKQQEVIEQAQKALAAAHKARPADDPWAPRPMVVTFLDFNTLGGSPDHAGLHDVLAQRVAQALAGTKRVQVVERRLLNKMLEELKLSASDLSDPDTRLKVGRILVARLIATGEIVFVNEPQLAVNLRMIDTETTEIKFNLSKDSADPQHVLAMADEIALGIADQLRREYPIRGKIIAVDGEEVVLNIGAKHGLTPGVVMKAVVEEPVMVNGEVVARKKKEIGKLEVTAVEEKAAFARVIERKGSLGKETKVIEALTTGATP